MKQRGIRMRTPWTLAPEWSRLKSRYVPTQTEKGLSGALGRYGSAGAAKQAASSGLFAWLRPAFQAGDQLVQLQLAQPLAHGVELARGVLDQRTALRAELERLAQPRLVRVEPGDDLLQALDRGLVGGRLSCGHPASLLRLRRRAPPRRRRPSAPGTRPRSAVRPFRRAGRRQGSPPPRSPAPGFAAGRARRARSGRPSAPAPAAGPAPVLRDRGPRPARSARRARGPRSSARPPTCGRAPSPPRGAARSPAHRRRVA